MLRAGSETLANKMKTEAQLSFNDLILKDTLSPILDSIVVSIPACHAGGRGSIPRRGDFFALIKNYYGIIKIMSNV